MGGETSRGDGGCGGGGGGDDASRVVVVVVVVDFWRDCTLGPCCVNGLGNVRGCVGCGADGKEDHEEDDDDDDKDKHGDASEDGSCARRLVPIGTDSSSSSWLSSSSSSSS